jgi:hypothetical protein
MLTALCFSALLSASASSTLFSFPNTLKNKWCDIAKNNPEFALEMMTELAQERFLRLTAEKDGQVTGLTGQLNGLTGQITGLTAQVTALESEKVVLNERLGLGHVEFLKASRNLCVRGVLEMCEARYSQQSVANGASPISVWIEIFRQYPSCFRCITDFDKNITSWRAAQVIAGIYTNASIALHHYGIDAVPLGSRAYSPEQRAILKGIMQFLPIKFTEVEDPVMEPLVI